MDIPRKTDGSIDFDQWFTGKSKDEQKVLAKGLKNEVDYDAYMAWKEAVNEGKTATIVKLQNENKELDATIAALNTIESFQKKLKTG